MGDSSSEQSKPPTCMSEDEQATMKAIETNNIDDFKKCLEKIKDVNFIDDDKMTPLQQASYRGNSEIVKLLLDNGADVNKCEHENDYNSLHFGALSGNLEVCHLLLAAGVNPHAVNSIKRTPSQLASFVGYHSIVCTINNFIPKDDILYYTQTHGVQSKPYLTPEIFDDFYKFALLYNLNPVKIAMILQSYKTLVDNIDDVIKVFTLMSEKEMRRKETNEVLSFKFYYISYILKDLANLMKTRKEANANEDKTFVEIFCKKLLKANKEGNLEYMDVFIKECVREFPFIDSTLFRQMVASLASDNAPPALNIVSAAINGQRAFVDDTTRCETCGEEKPTKKCAKCKNVSYCNRECQRLQWFMHKKACVRETTDATKNVDVKELTSNLQGLLAGN